MQFVNILLRIFLCLYSRGILVCSFLIVCLFGFSIRLMLLLQNQLGSVPLFSVFRKTIYSWYYFFHTCLVEFTSKTIWAHTFLCGNILKHGFNCFHKCIIQAIYFFLSELSLYLQRNLLTYLNCKVYESEIFHNIPLFSF